MALSDRQILYHLSRMPFIDPAELAGILGEPHSTVRRRLAKNGKGVLGSLCAVGRSCSYRPHFAIENRRSDRRQRALVYQPAQAAANFLFDPRRDAENSKGASDSLCADRPQPAQC